MEATAVEFQDVRKHFGKVEVLKGISFSVPKGSFVTLLGGSGSGKTTTLRLLAGLEVLDAGRITIGGTVVNSSSPRVSVPPERRRLGLMFQSYALWPHMTVFEQVAYPLKARHDVKGLNDRVEKALERVHLSGMGRRYPSELSGGQQQRVALARAVVHEPELLLLDEPLSNLDASLRERMRHEIQQLHHRLGLTTVYVTHDQQEALSLSDDVILMHEGSILEHGTPKQMYERPEHEETARFVGSSNMLYGRVLARGPSGVSAELDCGIRVEIAADRAKFDDDSGDRVVMSVKAEDVQLGKIDDPAFPVRATIESVAYLGWHSDLIVRVAEQQIHVRTLKTRPFQPGEQVGIAIPEEGVSLFVAKAEPTKPTVRGSQGEGES